MPSFTPPTTRQPLDPNDRLFRRYFLEVGQSVVKRAGTYQLTPFPWIGELEGRTEGVDYFMGGRTYSITEAVATALEVDGFIVDAPGFGSGAYGFGLFGA